MNSMPYLEAEVGWSARSEEGAMPKRIVTDERRGNLPKIGFPSKWGMEFMSLCLNL